MATFATSNERTNYARLCRAIIDLCTQLLRDFLYRQITSPANLKNKICRCPDLRSAGLKPNQWTYINNATTTGSYREFDITLLYQVIRLLSAQDLRDELRSNINSRKRNKNQNQIITAVQGCPARASDSATALSTSELAEIKNADNVGSFDQCKDVLLWKLFKHLCPFPNSNVVHPTKPWGSSNMPDSSKITLGDDIERIRLIRNSVYGHVPTTKISNTDFDAQWAVLEDIMTRMNNQLGGHYMEDLDYIKVTCMDYATEKTFCDEIKRLSTAEMEVLAKVQTEIETFQSAVDHKLEQTRTQIHEGMETRAIKILEDVDKLKTELEGDRQTTFKSFTDIQENFSHVEKKLQSDVSTVEAKLQSGIETVKNTLDKKLEQTQMQLHKEMDTKSTKLKGDIDKLKSECEEERQTTSKSLTDMKQKLTQVQKEIKEKPEDNKTEPTRQVSSLEKRTSLMIDQHRNDKTFVTTEAVNKGIEILTEHGMLIYSGLPGDGKTKNALEIMSHFRESNPDLLFLKLDDVRMWSEIHPDVNTVILFDDCLGSTNTDSGLSNDGNEYWPSIHACVQEGKVKVIMTIRKHILVKNLTKLEKYVVFSEVHTVDLTSNEIKLTKDVKLNILEHHFVKNNISVPVSSFEENYRSVDDKTPVIISQWTVQEIIDTDPLIGFPQTCFMFCSIRKYTRLGVKFFQNPTRGLIEEIDQLIEQGSNGKMQYCIMAYMLLKGGRIDFNNVHTDMFSEVSKSINLHITPSKREYNTAKKGLIDTYIVGTGENDVFEFKHQTILESVALCFYNDNPSLLFRLCSKQFIEEFIRPQTYKESEGEIVLRLKHNEYKYLIERFLSSLQQGNGEVASFDWWMKHPLLDDIQFVNDIMDVIKSDDTYKQIIQNCISNHGLFYFVCLYGKTQLVNSLYNLFDVTDMSTKDCLSIACRFGHTSAAMWLLDNKVGLGGLVGGLRCAHTDTLISMIKHPTVTLSSVIVAIYKGDMLHDHKSVETLLSKWPDIEQRHVLKMLYDFFKCGNSKAVDVIIKKRPDVITQEVITDGFRWACILGHIDTMNLYLNIKHSNINCNMIHVLQNDENITNLHIAAYLGRLNVCIKLTELGLCVTDRIKSGLSVLQMVILGFRFNSLNPCFYGDPSCPVLQYVNGVSLNFGNISDFKQLLGFLMDHKDIDKTDLDMPLYDCGKTLVHYCVWHNDLSIIQFLYKKYPSVLSVSDKMDLTPMYLAILLGRSEIFKILYSMKTVHETDLDLLNSFISRGRQYAGKESDELHPETELFSGLNKRTFFSTERFGTSKDYASISRIILDDEDNHNN